MKDEQDRKRFFDKWIGMTRIWRLMDRGDIDAETGGYRLYRCEDRRIEMKMIHRQVDGDDIDVETGG